MVQLKDPYMMMAGNEQECEDLVVQGAICMEIGRPRRAGSEDVLGQTGQFKFILQSTWILCSRRSV